MVINPFIGRGQSFLKNMAKSLTNISVETVKHIMREYLKKGHEMQFIRSSLLKAGVPRSKLDAAQKEVSKKIRSKKVSKKPPKKKKKPKKPFFGTKKEKKPRKTAPAQQAKMPKAMPPQPFIPRKAFRPVPAKGYFWRIFLPLLIVAIVIIALLVVFVSGAPKDCGTDEACFVRLANDCKAAKLKNTVDTTTIEYVTKDCQLTKKIVGLSPDEPQEVRDLFMGLRMTCNYAEDNFDPAYIDEISGNLETCTGSLATVIRELRR